MMQQVVAYCISPAPRQQTVASLCVKLLIKLGLIIQAPSWMCNVRSYDTVCVCVCARMRVCVRTRACVCMCVCWRTMSFVSVADAPVIVVFPSDKTVISKESVKWHCKAEANPAAVIRWMKNGIRVGNSPNIKLSDDANTIEFQSVERQDAGEYTCRAKNKIGKSTVSATLEVYGEHFVVI